MYTYFIAVDIKIMKFGCSKSKSSVVQNTLLEYFNCLSRTSFKVALKFIVEHYLKIFLNWKSLEHKKF